MLTKQRKGLAKEQALSRKMLGITPASPSKSAGGGLLSRHTKLILACLGGLGALLGAIAAKHYNSA